MRVILTLENYPKLFHYHVCISTYRVKQHSAYILSIAILEARTTELTFDPYTVTTTTHCLGV